MMPFSGRKDGLSVSEALPDRSLFTLVAMMSFLAALTLAGATGARALSARWAGGAAQLVTVQVPDPDQPLTPASKKSPQAPPERKLFWQISTPCPRLGDAPFG